MWKTSNYDKPAPKKTSQSKKKKSVKWSSMHKHKKRSFKIYNSQGRN